MNTKHTPGPWVVNPLQLDQVCTADAHSVVAFATARSSVDQTIANASLIAAAPDLLEALKLSRLLLIAHGESHAKIDAAIAKATGEST